MKNLNFSISQGKNGVIEFFLMCFALFFVLTVGYKISTSNDDSQRRWQRDIADGGLKKHFLSNEFLILRWCSRDFKHIQKWLGSGAHQLCRKQTQSAWSVSIQDLSSSKLSPEEALDRWKSDVVERANQWRAFFMTNNSQDNSFSVLSELSRTEYIGATTNPQLSLELQAADEWLQRLEINRERARKWDEWQREFLDPALKMPSSKAAAEALINLASSLDGKGNDSVGQLVRQSLDANQNAYRAGQSLALLNNLYTVLFVHWLVTGALTCLLRCRISLFYRINAYLFLGLLTWVGFYYLGVTSNPLEAPYWLVAGCIIFVVNWCFHTFFLTKQPSQKLCRPFSHWVIPGWWFFTALGWLLILDQSLHFHSRNRFLVLEQWQAWWLAGLILPLSTLVSSPIAKGLLLIGSHWFQPGRRIQHIVSSLVGICLVLIMYVAHQLQIRQYVTGELLKLIFIFSVSTWCVWKMPSASSYWYANLKLQSLLQTLPCLLILVVVTAIAVVTRDKGPLLVIYIMAIILFSSLAGWTSGLVIIAFGFLLIFLIGPDLDVVGSRLQALRDPFSADHDDMARIIWFQSFAAEHPWGFGPGQVPWCGLASLDQCRGLPLQLQSDYTFTAIVGWWGLTGAMLFLIIFVLFCFHLLAHGARCNQVYIQPLSMCEQSVQVLAIKSALLFFSGSLMLLQVWITAAGNTGWLPLTGLTWPLVGFGKTSLWVTTWLIGSLSFDITDA